MPAGTSYTRVVTAPTAIPISLEEARRHLRLSADDEDTLLVDYLHACRDYLQDEVTGGITLLTTTYDRVLPCFGGLRNRIELPLPPLQSITSITYLDPAGASQTLTENTHFASHKPSVGRGWVVPTPEYDWPDTADDRDNAVTIRFVAGYTPATLPHKAKQAVRLMLGSFFEFRESTIVGPKSSEYATELPVSAKRLMDGLDWGSYA